jgi:PKD repeat protein
MSAGGWSLPVDPGAHTVTCSGGPFAGSATADVDAGSDNVEVDFRSGVSGGDVAFVIAPDDEPDDPDDPPDPPAPGITASTDRGTAPLTVNLAGGSEMPGATLSWELGDGSTAQGGSIEHVFDDPGLYPVVLRADDGADVATEMLLVTAAGSEGAGPGTTPPGSTGLSVRKLKAKAKHAKVGKDQLKLQLEFEMPAGFVLGDTTVEVAFGSLSFAFPMGGERKVTDAEGRKLSLKYDRPDDDAPLGAGVAGRIKLKVKGDLGDRLAICGVRNADEVRTVDVPIALRIGGQIYRGIVSVSIDSRAGNRSILRPE